LHPVIGRGHLKMGYRYLMADVGGHCFNFSLRRSCYDRAIARDQDSSQNTYPSQKYHPSYLHNEPPFLSLIDPKRRLNGKLTWNGKSG
jgi:hypothetical protein